MGAVAQIFGYLLNFLYQLFSNYGIAIIVFSILLKVIMIPITIKQQKAMKKSTELQNEMMSIQKKYKNDPERMNQETIELYKREKMNPFSGCLSSILQFIIILSVFWLVSQPLTYMKKVDSELINKYTNEMKESGFNKNNGYVQIGLLDYAETKYQEMENLLINENIENREEIENKKDEYNQLRINMSFLGIDLSKVPQMNLKDWKVYIIPLLYVITSIISTKLTMNTQLNQNKKEDEGPADDTLEQMQNMNKSMSYMLPIMSVMIAFIAPLGLALYWLMTNILMIIERLIINKIVKNKQEA